MPAKSSSNKTAKLKPKPKPKTQAKAKRSPIPPGLRFDVLARAKFRCQACAASAKEDGVRLEIDHIIPVSQGGTNAIKNLQVLCRTCNRGKAAKMKGMKVVAKKSKIPAKVKKI